MGDLLNVKLILYDSITLFLAVTQPLNLS